jgi:hypothetical protein
MIQLLGGAHLLPWSYACFPCFSLVDAEYVDENTLIPQNSTVVVHRVAVHPTDVIITSYVPSPLLTP